MNEQITQLKAVMMDTQVDALSDEVLFAAIEASLGREKALLASERKISSALRQLHGQYKSELQTMLGAEAQKYSVFQNRKRERAIDIQALYTVTPEGEMLKQTLQRQISSEARELLDGLAIDPAAVEKLQRDYMNRAVVVLEEELRTKETTPYILVSPSALPKFASSPWRWYRPPYANKYGWRYWDGSGGSRWVTTGENHVTGVVSIDSSMRLHGADDSDYSYTNALSEIWVNYRIPATGLIEGWAELEAIDNRFSGCLDDEWGFSDASIQQQSRIYMQVASPNWGGYRYGTLTDYRRGESEGCWSGRICGTPAGQIKWVQLFSMDSYPAGRDVTVAIGLHDYNYFWVNDMSCDASMTNRWFIKQVVLRSTGTP